ncbi:hypothetical protein E0494_04560 [Marinilabiliaceae bacterium JC040]|nr:hypothetical protein [Marinilabiliaceae bacterium JC040]
MNNLFEYQNKESFPNSFESLEFFLDDIWRNREKSCFYNAEKSSNIEAQRFLQFLHKTKEIKSNKYVGVIHFEGEKINLLPKIFYKADRTYSENDVNAINEHILWWLSYCRKISFPNYETSLGGLKSDFFEVLIYLFAKFTRELLSDSLYQQYEEIDDDLSFIKGRINTREYINENISKGRWHKISCSYDAFVFDNKFNRIVKYVANMLFTVSSNLENKKYLREILFLLDDVSDVKVCAEDCLNIDFNPMYKKFTCVKDYCYLFLSNSVSFDYKNDLKLFAFLLPMEYVFEDFIYGFIDKELKDVKAKAQDKSKFLDQDCNFSLRPDLVLEMKDRSVIADTKYKLVYSDENDPKNGISQSDLYQMLAYAIRFKIDEIYLLYPNTIYDLSNENSKIVAVDEFADDKNINIMACQLPIINMDAFNDEYFTDDSLRYKSLSSKFDDTRITLKGRLEEVLLC